MSLLSYTELVENIVNKRHVRNVLLENVNGTSIDIRLGSSVLVEDRPIPLHCPDCGEPDFLLTDTVYALMRSGAMGNRLHVVRCPACLTVRHPSAWLRVANLSSENPLLVRKVDISDEPFMLNPKEVCLAHTVELFYLPLDITAEYRLKSSLARAFLEHLTAVWLDPGWHGSSLTLELCNMSNFHRIPLTAGMKCGQVSFTKHAPVPEENSYKMRGKYNNDVSVSQSKGVT